MVPVPFLHKKYWRNKMIMTENNLGFSLHHSNIKNQVWVFLLILAPDLEKAPQSCKHRSIAASRQHQLEQEAQEHQTV
jgi:hypothetical protein